MIQFDACTGPCDVGRNAVDRFGPVATEGLHEDLDRSRVIPNPEGPNPGHPLAQRPHILGLLGLLKTLNDRVL